jgi:hypothetical protein
MRRRPLIFTAIGLAVLFIAYSIYWFVLARVVGRDIADWVNQWHAEGFVVIIGEPVIGGFPLAVRAHLPAPDITAPDGSWHWQGPDTELHVAPWAPFDLWFSAPGHHHLVLAGSAPRDIALEAGQLELGLDMRSDGRLTHFSLDLAEATLADSLSGIARVATAAILGRLPWPASNDPSLSSLDLTVDAAGIELPPGVRAALGQKIEKLHVVSQVMGTMPALLSREALAGWRDAGGVLQLRESELDWGPLWAAGDGTLTLDQSMQPLAAGSIRIAGLTETLNVLTAAGLVQPGPAKLAQIMFGALAQVPAEGGRPQVKLPLSIQDGFVYMGPVKLAQIQPIDWSGLP